MDYIPWYNGGDVWSSEMNKSGFMGFVDKCWILWNRISTIITIVCLAIALITTIIAIFAGSKEGYYTSRMRHNKRYK